MNAIGSDRPRSVVLDAGPLGRLANPVRSVAALETNRWLQTLVLRGNRIVVPAIADYEVRRELERTGRVESLRRLDAFNRGRYLPLTDAALRVAARLWGQARNRGAPTGDPRELDCDVLIAAQALSLGLAAGEIVVATTNVGHLSQFVPAELWNNIR